MRTAGPLFAAALALGLTLAGCAPVNAAAVKTTGPASLLVTQNEATAHGGWTVAPDSGPVGGDTTDCTGAPFSWPKLNVVAHASQVLGRADNDSMAVVVKQLDGGADADVKALRTSLEPCAPASGIEFHGAMLHPVGDDSFAYQTEGTDKGGKYILDDTLIACGEWEMEAIRISYSPQPDQAGIESVLASAIKRMLKSGHCTS